MKTLLLAGFLPSAAHQLGSGARPTPSAAQQVAEARRVLHRVNPARSATGWLHLAQALAGRPLLFF